VAGTYSYQYDALRRRVLDGQTWYIYDGWRVVEERDRMDFRLKKSYTYGSYLDEPLVMEQRVTKADGSAPEGDGARNDSGYDDLHQDAFAAVPVAQRGFYFRKYFYHHDQVYSVHALTGADGKVYERYVYDAYGKAIVLNASWTPKADPNNSAMGNPYAFTGRVFDKGTGIYYFRNRYFDPRLGSFISRDLLGYHDGYNLYRAYFVPEKNDPLGLCEDWSDKQDTDQFRYEGICKPRYGGFNIGFSDGTGGCCCLKWQYMYELLGYSSRFSCAYELSKTRLAEEGWLAGAYWWLWSKLPKNLQVPGILGLYGPLLSFCGEKWCIEKGYKLTRWDCKCGDRRPCDCCICRKGDCWKDPGMPDSPDNTTVDGNPGGWGW
jgi:RHS repeat-associated protein